MNGDSTNSKVSFLGKNLHQTTDVDEDEKPPPAVPITQNNPSGGANYKGGRDNRVPDLRCVKCSRSNCKNKCDPGNRLKPKPGKSGTIDPSKVCGNCGLFGHMRGDCTESYARGNVLWKQQRQFIAQLLPLIDAQDHDAASNPYAECIKQAYMQNVQQPQGGVNVCLLYTSDAADE